MERDIKKIFVEIYSKPPLRNYSTNKILYKHFDEIWSIDSADFSDSRNSNKGFRYIIVTIVNF